jgi:predicted dehydrogenase
MRLGLLSTARINELLVAGARHVADVEVAAIGSRDLRRAQMQAAALEIPRVHSSYEAVLQDPDIDAVYVALPNSMHVDWSIRALQAGKHVLCEKPLASDPAAVERAFDAAEGAGLVLAEAFMWRHHPQARRLESLLAEIGEPRVIRATFSFVLDRPGDLRLSAELDGGALMDVGCYCISAARLVAGEPTAVTAQAVFEHGIDMRLVGTLRFPGDVLAHIDCGFDVVARDELEIAGSRGALFLDDPWHSRAAGIELRRSDGSSSHVEVEHADPYACELADFAAAIAGKRARLFGRADAVSQARTIAALRASAASGSAVAP